MPPRNNVPKFIDLIKNDKVFDAFNVVKNATDWNIKDNITCLVELQLLLHKAIEASTTSGGRSIKSSSNDVFILAEFCCSSVKQHGYECNISKLITCIYFIVKYLIENNNVLCAKKLSEYIIDLRKENKVFEEKDEVISRAIYRLFFSALSDMYLNSNVNENKYRNTQDSFLSSENSLIELWKFIVDLQKFDKVIAITDFIIFLGKCVTKLHSSNRNIVKFIHCDCLKYLINSLKSENYCAPPELNVAVTNALTLFLISIVSVVNSQQFGDLIVVLDSVKDLSALFSSCNHKNCFKFLENFIIFLYLYFVESSKRILSYEDVAINTILKNLCVLLKKLSLMDAEIFTETYFCILHLVSKIQFFWEKNPCKINYSAETFGCLLEFLFTVTDYKHNVIKLEDCEPVINENEQIKNSFPCLYNVYVLVENLFQFLSKNDNLKHILHCHEKFSKRVIQDCRCLINGLLKMSSSFNEKYLFPLYNICSSIISIYFKLELYDQCGSLAKQLCAFLISLPKPDYIRISKKCSVYNAFVMYTYCCGKLGKSLDGLIAITAWSIAQSCSKFNEKLIGFWTSVKLSYNCSRDIMGLTACDIAKDHANVLVNDWGISSSAIKSTDWSLFLLLEIRAYYSRSSLKGEALINAFRSLLSINPPADKRFLKNCVIIAESLIYVIDVAIKHVSTSEMDDEIKPAFDLVIDKLMKKKKRTVKESCTLGNLLHYKVRYDICSRRKSFENKFLNCTVTKLPLQIDRETGLAVDPRDSFDAEVIDSLILFAKQDLFMQELGNGLQLIKETLVQQNYFKAVDTIAENKNDLENQLTSELILLSLNNINCTAELYRLYCESKPATDAWHLLFDLCCIKHPNIALTAVSNLLDLTLSKDCGDLLFKKAASLGYRSISQFKSSDCLDCESLSDEEMLFFVQLARHNLMFFDNEMSCEKILNAVSEKSNFKKNLTYIQFLKTVCEFLALPGKRTWNGVPSNISKAINELYTSLRYIVNNSIWKDFSESLSFNRLLLETSLILGHYYYSLSFPREAHFYLKEQLKVAQELTLPIWTCRLLVSLCWVDINVSKLDDCELKMCNLETILGLNTKNDDFVMSHDTTLDEPSVYNNFKEDAYDDNGSPVFKKQERKQFYSSVSSVLENPFSACVFIDLITLKAVMFIARGSCDKAMTMFQYGLKMINKAENIHYSYLPITYWMAVRKAILLFYHGGLFDQPNECDKALEYYEKVLQYFDESSAHLYVHPLASTLHLSVNNSIMKLKFQQFFTDSSCPAGQENITNAIASLSLKPFSENVQTTPTLKPKIPLHLESSVKNIDKASLSPGDMPNNPYIRKKLFNDNNGEDDYVSDSSESSKVIPKSILNRVKRNKKPVGATPGKACKPFKLFFDNESDKNEDDGDKVKTRSKLPKATSSKTRPVRSTKKNQKK